MHVWTDIGLVQDVMEASLDTVSEAKKGHQIDFENVDRINMLLC